ncbi:MAG TPA: hypothetical protein VJR92_11040 [Gemmatimonadaceae bacterium]|nr:hypothetical protein [Gemmatimonadaceae bacterium]
MYTTCLYCNSQFEKNESIEAFPIGRRLAFDAAKGRLWVVCRKCERWCLSPLDERWEAIEQAEKLFRDTRTRVSTDNIGLAKVAEGTTLVRIGNPMRPEFAAWRYGDQFGRRRRRQLILSGAGLSLVGVAAAGVVVAGTLGAVGTLFGLAQMMVKGHPTTVVAKVRALDGTIVRVRRKDLSELVLSGSEGGGVTLDLTYAAQGFRLMRDADTVTLHNAAARRVAAMVVPKLNAFGGNKSTVVDAVDQIEAAGDGASFVDRLTHARGRRLSKKLVELSPAQRLALEMSLHEDAERRALEGELAELEKAWRDAEEIAGISDSLTVPASIDAELERLKKR